MASGLCGRGFRALWAWSLWMRAWPEWAWPDGGGRGLLSCGRDLGEVGVVRAFRVRVGVASGFVGVAYGRCGRGLSRVGGRGFRSLRAWLPIFEGVASGLCGSDFRSLRAWLPGFVGVASGLCGSGFWALWAWPVEMWAWSVESFVGRDSGLWGRGFLA